MSECTHIINIIESLKKNQANAIKELERIQSKPTVSDSDKELINKLSEQILKLYDYINETNEKLAEICPGFTYV